MKTSSSATPHDAGAADARFEAVADYYENREARPDRRDPGSYRPLEPDSLYLSRDEWQKLIETRPLHLATSFHEPESARVLDFGVDNARDFAPERSQNANIYEAVVAHVAELRRAKKKVVLASYSRGSRERLKGLLADHGLTGATLADDWQEALGAADRRPSRSSSSPSTTASPPPDLALLTEQDMLGDRLVRRRKRRKSADAFLSELATLTPGDLVVHADHGIGRYEGLTQIPVGTSPHDCVALEYAGGDKLYVPVENIDILSRYGSESDGVALDKLGGEAWQRRKSRMKERIREIAGELIKTAAERALRPGAVVEPDTSYAAFADRFPYEETEDQDRAIADVFADLEAGKPMDRLVCGDVGFGKTEVALRAAFAAAMAGYAGRFGLPDHPPRPPALQHLRRALPRLSDRDRPPFSPRAAQRRRRRLARASPPARSTSSSAPTRSWPRAWSSSGSASSSSTRSSASASPTRSG